MTLDDLLALRPNFHAWDDGTPTSMHLAEPVLRFLDRELRPGMRTLETGEGYSTVLFAIHGTSHTCVSPDPRAHERIRAFCLQHQVPMGGVTFDNRASQDALPQADLGDLDVVLIDGGHGFPTPFIDWYYAGSALRAGGLMVIDDTQLWTGRALLDFMLADPSWELVHLTPRRAAVFRRVVVAYLGVDWIDQPFMLQAAARTDRWRPRVVWTARMIRTGQWDQLANRVGRVAGRLGRRLRPR